MALRLNIRHVRFAALVILLVVVAYLLMRLAGLVAVVFELAILTLFAVLVLEPLVRALVSYGSPRWSAVLVTVLFFVLLIVLVLALLIPPFIVQFQQLVQALPSFWLRYQEWLSRLSAHYPGLVTTERIQGIYTNLLLGVQQYAIVARSVLISTFGLFTGLVFILVATIYTLMNPWPLLFGLRGLFPRDWWDTIEDLAKAIAYRIQRWALGILALGLLIGVLDYIGLYIVNLIFGPNIPFLLFFAILGGLLEMIPIIGPIIAAILPALVALAIDPYMAIAVVITYIIIQQLENHLAAPLIMQKAVSLHPVTIIFTLAGMATLFGIFGALIAVPVASTLKVIYERWYYPLTHGDQSPLTPPNPDAVAIRLHQEWHEQQQRRFREWQARREERRRGSRGER